MVLVSSTSKLTTAEWDTSKIGESLVRETSELDKPIYYNEAMDIARTVENHIKRSGLNVLSTSLIRGLVENELLNRGMIDQLRACSEVGIPVYDAFQIDVGEGFEANENANLQANPETGHKKKADKISKDQYLLRMPRELSVAHLSGDFHIHDLEYFGTRPFCQDHDLRYVFYYGLMPDGVGASASVAGPAKRPEVAMLHAVKHLSAAQTNFAGGQGFYNFLTFMAPYLEGLSYEDIKQLMQMLCYEMTQMMVARGGQVVFSSLQLSPGVPDIWKDKPAVFKGTIWDGEKAPLRTYGEFEREVRLGFMALMNIMMEGDDWGKPFNFPKPEVSIEPCFVGEGWDKKIKWFDRREAEDLLDSFLENHPMTGIPHEDRLLFIAKYFDLLQVIPSYEELYEMAFELAAKFGTPYFDNQLPEYRGGGTGITCYQCCAYCFQSRPGDLGFADKLNFVDGQHFSMGGWQVVSLNLPRAGYRGQGNYDQVVKEIHRLVDRSIEVFKLKREYMDRVIAAGTIPFATQRPKDPKTREPGAELVDFTDLVYAVGVIGLNELVQFCTGDQLHESERAMEFGERILLDLGLYVMQRARDTGLKLVLARTPAESTAQRFAMCDIASDQFREATLMTVKGDLDRIDEKAIYYSNGPHLAVNAPVSIFERIAKESRFFPLVEGGNIFHIFLGEKRPRAGALMDLGMKIAKETDIGYFAFTNDLTVCLDCSAVSRGVLDVCDRCGSHHIDHLSRVTGYLQSVSGWNEAKKQELKDRQKYGGF